MPNLNYFEDTLEGIANLVDAAVPILIGIGLIIFFWGLVKYIRTAESGDGKKIMLAGLAGLFIMVSVWGIIKLGQSVLGVQANDAAMDAINAPNVPR